MTTFEEPEAVSVEREMNETPDEELEAEEEETPAATEPEPEPDHAGLTEQEAERISKQLDNAAKRYVDKAFPLAHDLGLPVEPCPLCMYPGLTMQRDVNEVTSDVVANIDRLIGRSAPQEFSEATDAERCPSCDGWGDVLTGARKEIARTKPCTPCGGKGWIQKLVAVQVQAQNPPLPFPGASVAYSPLPQGIPDQWGRPAGHTHWGLDPASVGAT